MLFPNMVSSRAGASQLAERIITETGIAIEASHNAKFSSILRDNERLLLAMNRAVDLGFCRFLHEQCLGRFSVRCVFCGI